MRTTLLATLVGAAALAASSAASAHVDISVGLGVPGVIYEEPPVVYAPPPAVVSYGYPYGYAYGDDWRERRWRRHEWHERHWRHDDDD
jgi:hypothetical protein